jgi:hypothetical protein
MKITAAGKLVRITGEPDIDPEKSTLNHNLLHIKCSASASNAIYHQFPLLKEPKFYSIMRPPALLREKKERGRSRNCSTVMRQVRPVFAVVHRRRDRAGGDERNDLATLSSLPTAPGMSCFPSIPF